MLIKIIYAVSLFFFCISGLLVYKAFMLPSVVQDQVSFLEKKGYRHGEEENPVTLLREKDKGNLEQIKDLWLRLGDLRKASGNIDFVFEKQFQFQLERLEKLLMALMEERDASHERLVTAEKQLAELEMRLSKMPSGVLSDIQKDRPQSRKYEAVPDPPITQLDHASSNNSPSEKQAVLLVVTLGQGLFRSGQTQASSELEQKIKEALPQIKEYPGALISVEGHADNIPLRPAPNRPYNDNMGLSVWRATIVAAKLVEGGILPERIKVVGYGETCPLASNQTKEGRDMNRRVEIRVLKP